MNYLKTEGGKVSRYPYTLSHLRSDNPQVSFPRAFDGWETEYGVYPVALTGRPAPSDPLTKDVIEGEPVLTVDGAWVQTWAEVDADPVEATARQQEATDTADREAVKADDFVARFLAMTPAEVADYVDNNTASLAAARTLLKKMALMLLLLARREFRG